jgi:RHS repeat-associated protein
LTKRAGSCVFALGSLLLLFGGCSLDRGDDGNESVDGAETTVFSTLTANCGHSPEGQGSCYEYDWPSYISSPDPLKDCVDPAACGALPPSKSSPVGSIDGAFEVTPAGDASYTVPIEVPPGRNGIAPLLDLTYNSGQGDGLLGRGWSLRGLPQVHRCNHAVGESLTFGQIDYRPDRLATRDQICLSGKELVPVEDPTTGSTHYRTRRDSFMRIEEESGGFVAFHRNGQIWEFGEYPAGDDSCVTDAAQVCKGIVEVKGEAKAWMLRRVRDRWGNFLQIDYEQDYSNEQVTESRPTKITYTGSTKTDSPGDRVVKFAYKDREYTESSQTWSAELRGFKDGLEFTRTKVLSEISTHVDNELVLEYQLDYDYRRVIFANSQEQPAPVLTQIRLCDGDGVCKRPTQFEWESTTTPESLVPYTDDVPTGRWSVAVVNELGTAIRPSERPFHLDLNGDGRTDILFRDQTVAGRHRIIWGHEILEARDEGAEEIHAPLASGLPDEELLPFEYTLDGLVDFVLLSDPGVVFVNNGDGTFSEESAEEHDSIQGGGKKAIGVMNAQRSNNLLANLVFCDSETYDNPYLRFIEREPSGTAPFPEIKQLTRTLGCDKMYDLLQVDRNGNGQSSLLFPYRLDEGTPVLSPFPLYYGEFASNDPSVPQLTDIPFPPGSRTTPPLTRVLDFNGDGLQDVVIAYPDASPPKIEAWINTGRDFQNIGAVYTASVPKEFSLFYDLEQSHDRWGRPTDFVSRWNTAVVIDIDGNGRDDLIIPKIDTNTCKELDDCSPNPYGGIGEWVVLMASLDEKYSLAHLRNSSEVPLLSYEPFHYSAEEQDFVYKGAGWPSLATIDLRGEGKPDLIRWWWDGWVGPDAHRLEVTSYGHPRKDLKVVRIREGSLGVDPSSPKWNDTWNYHIEYERMGAREHFYAPSGGESFSRECSNSGPCVHKYIRGKRFVTHYSVRSGSWTEPLDHSIEYDAPVVDFDNNGFLGFGARTISREPDGKVVVEVYDFEYDAELQTYPFLGMVSQRLTQIPLPAGGVREHLEVNNFDFVETAQPAQGGANSAYFAYASRTDWTTTDRIQDEDYTLRTGVRHLTDPDQYGNFGSIVTRAGDLETTVRSDYSNDARAWLIGRPVEINTTFDNHGSSRPPMTRTMVFKYDSVNDGRHEDLRHIIREPQSTPQVDGEDAERVEIKLEYDEWGNVVYRSAKDPKGEYRLHFEKSFQASSGYFPTKFTNAKGHSTSRTYSDEFGSLLVESGPNGLTTRWSYDGFGRLVQQAEPDGRHTRWDYREIEDDFGFDRLLVHTGTSGEGWQATVFDEFHRPVKDYYAVAGDYAAYVGYGYDEFGRMSFQTSPQLAGNWAAGATTIEWDDLSRPLFKQAANGEVTSFEYVRSASASDPGRWDTNTVITDPKGNSRTLVRDGSGNVIRTVDEDGNETEYRYGALGYASNVIDSKGNETTSHFDRHGRLVRLRSPDFGVKEYSYNAFGDLEIASNPNSIDKHKVRFEYDEIGRLVTRESFEGESLVGKSSWQYDTASNGIGLLAEEKGEDGHTRSYQYDGLSRTVEIVEKIDGIKYRRTFDYGLLFGKLRSMSLPESIDGAPFIVDYSYDQYGKLAAVSDGDTGQLYASFSDENAAEQWAHISYGNGVNTERSFDAQMGRIHTIHSSHGQQTEDLQILEYGFDPNGNLRFRRDDVNRQVEWFRYDPMNRLTGWEVSDECIGECPAEQIRYDALGNVVWKEGVGNYEYDPLHPHQVTGITDSAGNNLASYGYDRLGNQVERPGYVLEYTNFNKPRRISREDGFSVDYEYDANSNRVLRETPDERIHFVGKAYERSLDKGSGDTRELYRVFAEGRAVAEVVRQGSSESRYFLLHDHLGSIDVVTDETGAAVERRSYRPFGQPRESNWDADRAMSLDDSDVPLGFTGHRHEGDGLDLIDMEARLYDPSLGRFLSADPLVSRPFHSQGWNRYSYVENNPLRYVDPTGFTKQCDPMNPRCSDSGWSLIPGDPRGWGRAARKAGRSAKRGARKAWDGLKSFGRFVTRPFGNDDPGTPAHKIERHAPIISGVGDFVSASSGRAGEIGDYLFRSSSGIETCKELWPDVACTSANIAPMVTIAGDLGESTATVYGTYMENGGSAALDELNEQFNPAMPVMSSVKNIGEGIGDGDWNRVGTATTDLSVAGAGFFTKFRGGVGRKIGAKPFRCSFTAYTVVWMCDGSQKPIVDVEDGDWIMTRDGPTGSVRCGEVTNPYANPDRGIVELELVSDNEAGEVIETTHNHPFWVRDQGWTLVEHLYPGDELLAANGEFLTVGRILRTNRVETVYNFSVEEFRSYFVGENAAWVHNCFEFNSLRGKSHRYLRKSKPANWREVPAKNGKGWRWLDENGNERFRFMRPQKGDVQWQRQKQGYMRWRDADGNRLDADGNPVSRLDPEYEWKTHIPYEGIWP